MLSEIVRKTKEELEFRKRKIPPDLFELEGGTRSLSSAIRKKETKAIITEIKPASPSLGKIRDVDVPSVAADMQRGGACAISVLTEPFYFSGSLDNLRLAKNATDLPIMRKDFIVDYYQLLEAKHYGADAVLLMVSVLGEQVADFYSKARELGLEAIVEVHDKGELELASKTDAEIIGINNRNLVDLKVDLNTTRDLVGDVPSGRIIVSESGVTTKDDLDFVLSYADAALVGTALMVGDDIVSAISSLLK